MPGDVDLETVIGELEAELGETVSQRIAARFLGVSHTALGHRVRGGSIPLVENRAGRREVPVPALLRFKPTWGGAGGADSFGGAAGVRGDRRSDADRDHAAASDRSLAYHRAVADRLTRGHVADACYRVRKWRAGGKLDPTYADEWEQVLQGSLAQIRAILTDPSSAAADLRQSSPFAGILSESERRTVIGAPVP